MTDAALDQAVIQKMNELMRASSECAEFDPAMSAKFAATAKDLGRDLGIAAGSEDVDDVAVFPGNEQGGEEDEFHELLHLLDLQKKAVAAVETAGHQKSRFGWLGLDVWSRW